MFDAGRDGLMMVFFFFDSAVKDYPSFILPMDDYKDPNTRCVSWPQKDPKQRRNGKKNFYDNQCKLVIENNGLQLACNHSRRERPNEEI